MQKLTSALGTALSLALLLLAFHACQKEPITDFEYGIDPVTQKDLLCKSLRLLGENKDGAMPSGNNTSGAVVVSHPQAVEISAGVLLFIPYFVNDTNRVCKIYLQVEGANNYWETRLTLDPTSRQPFFQILIPRFVQEGTFDIIFSLDDCNGNVSPIYNTRTLVRPITPCNTGISGNVGITVRSFDLGDKRGTARFNYNMYTIPDRMDIRYNGKWVASTGNLFSDAVIIPDCNNLQGDFVSGTGSLSFEYNPSVSRFAEVYVSGCLDGTAWDVFSVCPE